MLFIRHLRLHVNKKVFIDYIFIVSTLKRDFIELAKASGWSQAEIARQLELTRGGVNGIITGTKEPSKAMVRLLYLVLMSEKPEIFKGRPDLKEPGVSPENLGVAVKRGRRGPMIDLFDALMQLGEADRNELAQQLLSVTKAFKKSKGKQRKTKSGE